MLKNLWVGASGMRAQMSRMDNISNNLANVNTTGYKKGATAFADLMYQERDSSGMPVDPNRPVPQAGAGVKAALTRVFLQGNLRETGQQLDMAIQGKGFFAVELPDGSTALTRDGSFRLDEEGRLVNTNGLVLADDLEVPEGTRELRITADGEVTAVTGEGEVDDVGSIAIYTVRNPAGLKALGKNLFLPTEVSGEAEGDTAGDERGIIKQGYLENSNVDLAEELTNMITAQRAYEISSRIIRTADQMWGMANEIKR